MVPTRWRDPRRRDSGVPLLETALGWLVVPGRLPVGEAGRD